MKKFLLCTSALVLLSAEVLAQDITDTITVQEDLQVNSTPTVVYGAAANASGGENTDVVEQAADAQNPLGAPLNTQENDSMPSQNSVSVGPVPAQDGSLSQPEQVSSEPQIKPIQQESQQGILQPGELALPQPSTRIENELYQSGNDIIDVQAYPIDDVSTVTEPNIQPTIVSQ